MNETPREIRLSPSLTPGTVLGTENSAPQQIFGALRATLGEAREHESSPHVAQSFAIAAVVLASTAVDAFLHCFVLCLDQQWAGAGQAWYEHIEGESVRAYAKRLMKKKRPGLREQLEDDLRTLRRDSTSLDEPTLHAMLDLLDMRNDIVHAKLGTPGVATILDMHVACVFDVTSLRVTVECASWAHETAVATVRSILRLLMPPGRTDIDGLLHHWTGEVSRDRA